MNFKTAVSIATIFITVSISFTKALAQTATINIGPFGIGSCYTNNRTVQDNMRWVPQMEAIGLHFMRTCETSWRAVEPEDGKWTWDNLDKQLTYMTEHKISCGGLLFGNMPWDKSGKSFGLPSENIPEWSKYVTEVVKHVRGKVKLWEVWNEPPNGTRSEQTPADYANVVSAAYAAAKAVDPTCSIGLAAKSVNVNYLEQVIKAGARDHFDYIVLHPYEVLGGVADNRGTDSIYMSIVPTVRKMLAAVCPNKVNVPIIFTELGSDASKGTDHQAIALVKAYTMGIAQGVACIQWFEGMDGDSGPMGLIDGNGKVRPAYTAMGQMIKCLGQRPVYLGWTMLDDRNFGYIFRNGKENIMVAWSNNIEPKKIDLGRMYNIVNPLTGATINSTYMDLTRSPIIVTNVSPQMALAASRNKTARIPWGGDFSRAQSVKIEFGKTNVEHGLHTLAGDAIVADAQVYGGSSRAASVPGGNAFVIDPAFLSYSKTPIDVTVVVRRNEANDNSGFKLVYESTNGYKDFGWYTVPDNKEWHTKTWRITDPEFVAMYGFNFTLESDGNVYNKFYIQSVTVTKVK